ncbi:MAG: acetyl-CoA C-acyltransferase [Bdellovibrio sp.]|nr:MAG: acetyl-CoA C-acyltransferase [Bdellovibrio sp.]
MNSGANIGTSSGTNIQNRIFRRVAIIGGQRTPFTKSMTHYSRTSNKALLTESLNRLVDKFGLANKTLGDVALGAVMKNAEDWNLARECVLGSGLHADTPAYDVQRACGTGLETISHIALKIAAGQIEAGIGGGADTNSDIQGVLSHDFTWKLLEAQKSKTAFAKIKNLFSINFKDLKPKFPAVIEPRTGLSMGQHAEKMVQEWRISQRDQDELALMSHTNGASAYNEGFYQDLVFEFKGLKTDAILRPDTTIEKLSKLKPAFDFTGKGTLTAGNSTALTDGASVVLLASEDYAKKHNLPILAYFADFQSAAVNFVAGAGLLMAPTIAVNQLLLRNRLELQDFDYYEIHEAFAGQVLCTLAAWESAEYCSKILGRSEPLGTIDRTKMNIKGGSLALGHPFAATGGRLVGSLAKMLSKTKGQGGRGLISICTAGGMGVAAILES